MPESCLINLYRLPPRFSLVDNFILGDILSRLEDMVCLSRLLRSRRNIKLQIFHIGKLKIEFLSIFGIHYSGFVC